MFERSIFFSKVSNKDETRKFRLKTKWEENYFQLFVIENSLAWFALVTPEHLRSLAEQLDLQIDLYCKNLQEYICDRTIPNFNFDVEDDKFIMYQELENESLQIKYFAVNLEQINYQNAMENLFDELVSMNNELIQTQVNLKVDHDKERNQKVLYETQCSDFVEKYNKSEHQMYSAFILLLNEKKQRIQFLTELLEEYECGRKRKYVKKPAQNESKPSTSKFKENVSDSETSESEHYTTDDERNGKVSDNDADQNSLDFLGEDNPLPCLPVRKRSDERVSIVSVAGTSNFNLSLETIESIGLSQHDSEISKAPDDVLEGSDNDFCTQELLDDM